MKWFIIVGLIILAFIFIKFKDLKHKTFVVFLIILLLFFYTTGYRVLAGEDINWKSASGIEKGTKLYFSWLGGVFGNLKEVTGNAIKMDWGSKNETIDEEIKVVEEIQIE